MVPFIITVVGDSTPTPTTYYVAFNQNTTDTVTGMPTSPDTSSTASYTLPSGPSRTGYTFQGWGTTTTDSSPAAAGTSVTLTSTNSASPDTYYAIWEKNNYDINVDYATGSSSTMGSIKFTHSGTDYTSSQSLPYGDSITLTASANAGYTFDGWYTDASATTAVSGSGATRTLTVPAANTTYYAKFTADSYNVTFDGNNGYATGTDSTKNVSASGSTDFSTVSSGLSPSRSGYVFAGWYDAASGGNKVTGTNPTITAATTYYAHWYGFTVSPATKTWNVAQGYSSSDVPAQTVTVTNTGTETLNFTVGASPSDTTHFEDPTTPTITGGSSAITALAPGDAFTFNTQPKVVSGIATGTYTGDYTVSAAVTDGSSTSIADQKHTATLEVAAGTTYTLNYDANGGSGAPSQQTQVGNATFTVSTTAPTRTNYTFLGWATTSGATTATITATAAAAGTATHTVTAASNTETLYAVWKENWRVDFNRNYTSTDTTNLYQQWSTYNSGTGNYDYTYSSPGTPTRSGYRFTGWWTDRAGTVAVTWPSTLSANMTVYAGWVEEFTITAKTNPTSGAGTVQINTDAAGNDVNKTVDTGTSITLTAAPASGYRVKEWQRGGTTISGATGNTYTFNATETATYTVVFQRTYTITVQATPVASDKLNSATLTYTKTDGSSGTATADNSNSGTVSGTMDSDKAFSLTYQNDTTHGYHFTKWTYSTDGTSFTDYTGSTSNVTPTGNYTYQANFAPNTATVKFTNDSGAWGGLTVKLVDVSTEYTSPNTSTTGSYVFAPVANGTYNIYVNGQDTGNQITISDNDKEETFDYRQVNFGNATVTNSIGDSGLTTGATFAITATVPENTKIISGSTPTGGKAASGTGNLTTGTYVIAGTQVTFATDWSNAEYDLLWNKTTNGNGSTVNTYGANATNGSDTYTYSSSHTDTITAEVRQHLYKLTAHFVVDRITNLKLERTDSGYTSQSYDESVSNTDTTHVFNGTTYIPKGNYQITVTTNADSHLTGFNPSSTDATTGPTDTHTTGAYAIPTEINATRGDYNIGIVTAGDSYSWSMADADSDSAKQSAEHFETTYGSTSFTRDDGTTSGTQTVKITNTSDKAIDVYLTVAPTVTDSGTDAFTVAAGSVTGSGSVAFADDATSGLKKATIAASGGTATFTVTATTGRNASGSNDYNTKYTIYAVKSGDAYTGTKRATTSGGSTTELAYNAYLKVNKAKITKATVGNITSPVVGGSKPDVTEWSATSVNASGATATEIMGSEVSGNATNSVLADTAYTISWSPDDTTVQAGTQYTVTVTLTADSNHEFDTSTANRTTYLDNYMLKVDGTEYATGSGGVTVTTGDTEHSDTVTFTYIFKPTKPALSVDLEANSAVKATATATPSSGTGISSTTVWYALIETSKLTSTYGGTGSINGISAADIIAATDSNWRFGNSTTSTGSFAVASDAMSATSDLGIYTKYTVFAVTKVTGNSGTTSDASDVVYDSDTTWHRVAVQVKTGQSALGSVSPTTIDLDDDVGGTLTATPSQAYYKVKSWSIKDSDGGALSNTGSSTTTTYTPGNSTVPEPTVVVEFETNDIELNPTTIEETTTYGANYSYDLGDTSNLTVYYSGTTTRPGTVTYTDSTTGTGVQTLADIGLTLDPTTGKITGRPHEVGEFEFTITVSGKESGSAEKTETLTFKLKVDPATPTVTATYDQTGPYYGGNTVDPTKLTATAKADYWNPTLNDGAGDWENIDVAGTFSISPTTYTAGNNQPYTVTFTPSDTVGSDPSTQAKYHTYKNGGIDTTDYPANKLYTTGTDNVTISALEKDFSLRFIEPVSAGAGVITARPFDSKVYQGYTAHEPTVTFALENFGNQDLTEIKYSFAITSTTTGIATGDFDVTGWNNTTGITLSANTKGTDITVDINNANLKVGTHTATLTATAKEGATATLNLTFVVTPKAINANVFRIPVPVVTQTAMTGTQLVARPYASSSYTTPANGPYHDAEYDENISGYTYKVDSVSWTDGVGTFAGGKAYTVTVVLEADDNYYFEDPLATGAEGFPNYTIGTSADTTTNTAHDKTEDPTMTVNVDSSGTAKNKITMTYTFPPTAPTVTGKLTGTAYNKAEATAMVTSSGTGTTTVYYALIPATYSGSAPTADQIIGAVKGTDSTILTAGFKVGSSSTGTDYKYEFTGLDPYTEYKLYTVATITNGSVEGAASDVDYTGKDYTWHKLNVGVVPNSLAMIVNPNSGNVVITNGIKHPTSSDTVNLEALVFGFEEWHLYKGEGASITEIPMTDWGTNKSAGTISGYSTSTEDKANTTQTATFTLDNSATEPIITIRVKGRTAGSVIVSEVELTSDTYVSKYYALTTTDKNTPGTDILWPADDVYGHLTDTHVTYNGVGEVKFRLKYSDGTTSASEYTLGTSEPTGEYSGTLSLVYGKSADDVDDMPFAPHYFSNEDPTLANKDQTKFDGTNVYLKYEYTDDSGTTHVYYSRKPVATLTVQELTASRLTVSDQWTPTELTFNQGSNFTLPSVVPTATVLFNEGSALEGTTDSPFDYSPTTTNGGTSKDGFNTYHYRYGLTFDTDGKVTSQGTEIYTGATPTVMSKTTHDGKTLYACYTDINGNFVYAPVGILRVNDETSSLKVWVDNITDTTDTGADVSAKTGVTNDTRGAQEPEYGETLRANPVAENAGYVTYQWQRHNGTDFEDIDGATSSIYTLTKDDVGKQLRVVAKDDKNNVDSSNVVTGQKRSITFTVKDHDKNWDGNAHLVVTYNTGDFTLSNVINNDDVTIDLGAALNHIHIHSEGGSDTNWLKYTSNGTTASPDVDSYLTLPVPDDSENPTNYILGGEHKDYYRISTAQTALDHVGKILGADDITPIVVKFDDSETLTPVKGSKPVTDISKFGVLTDETRYEVDNSAGAASQFQWEYNDGGTWKSVASGGLDASGNFKPSTEYRVTIPVVTTADVPKFKGETNPGYVVINGNYYAATTDVGRNGTDTDASTTANVTLTFAPTEPPEADKLSTYVTAFFKDYPEVGSVVPQHVTRVGRYLETVATDDSPTTSPEKFTVRWYTGYTNETSKGTLVTPDGSTVKFQAGQKYTVEVDVKPADGYTYKIPANLAAPALDETGFYIDVGATSHTAQTVYETSGVYTMVFTFDELSPVEIASVVATVTQPVTGDKVQSAAVSVLQTVDTNGKTLTGSDVVTSASGNLKWYEAPEGTTDWTGITALTVTSDTEFKSGRIYKAEFDLTVPQVSSVNKYNYVYDSERSAEGHPVDVNFTVSGVGPINGAGSVSPANGAITSVTTTTTDGNKQTTYHVAVVFKAGGGGLAELTDIVVDASTPDVGVTKSGPEVNPSSKPYELVKSGADVDTTKSKWEYWTGSAWADVADGAGLSGDKFLPGYDYRVTATVTVDTDKAKVTDATKFYLAGIECDRSASNEVTFVSKNGYTGDAYAKFKPWAVDDGKYTLVQQFTVPGDVTDISVTFPEPVDGMAPVTEPVDYQIQTEINKPAGTWNTTDLTGAPADAAAIKGITTSSVGATFTDNKYYMVTTTITPKDGHAFEKDGTVYVTINGVITTVGTDADNCTMAVKKDSTTSDNEIGWAVAYYTDATKSSITAKYVAKTAPSDKKIAFVTTEVTAPSATQPFSTKADIKLARNVSGYDVTAAGMDRDGDSYVTLTQASWRNETDSKAMDTATFEEGKVYSVTYTLKTKEGYTFNYDTTAGSEKHVEFTIQGLKVTDIGTNPAPFATGDLNVEVMSLTAGDATNPGTAQIKVTFPAASGATTIEAVGVAYHEPDQANKPAVSYQYLNPDQVELDQDSLKNADTTVGSTWHTGGKTGALTDTSANFGPSDYTVASTFKAKTGFKFDNNTKFYVNGTLYTKADNPGNVEIRGDGTATVWHTFTGDTSVDSIEAVTGTIGGPYYVKTTGHNTVNGADHNTVPGGKQDIGFNFTYTVTGITVTYANGSKAVVTKSGTDYTTVFTPAGGSAEASRAATDAEKKLIDDARAVVNGVTLENNYEFKKSSNDEERFDDQSVYVTVGGVTSSVTLTSGKLVVKELTADAISNTGSLTNTAYDVSTTKTFSDAGISDVKVNFNTGTTVATTNYAPTDGAAKADGQVNSTHHYYKLGDASKQSASDAEILYPGVTEMKVAMNGRYVWLCYTDVNGHEVATKLQQLKVTAANDVVVNTTVPAVAGNSAVKPNVDTGRPYELVTDATGVNTWQVKNGSNWDDITAGTQFTPGNTYRVTATVKVKDGQDFPITDQTNFYLGGVKIDRGNANQFTVTSGSPDTYTLTLEYELPSADDTAIDNVHSIFTLDPTNSTAAQTAAPHSVTVAGQTKEEETKWYTGFDASAFGSDQSTRGTQVSTFEPGKVYTVVTVVKPENGYKFTDATKFYFDFPTLGNQQVTTGSGLVKGSGSDPNYYMYYTFPATTKAVDSITDVTGTVGGPYYAQTTNRHISHNETNSNTTGKGPNTAANNPVPGGLKDIGFTFNYTISSITVKYTHDTDTTVKVEQISADKWTITSTKGGDVTEKVVEKTGATYKVTTTVNSGSPTEETNLAAIPADLQQDINVLTGTMASVNGVALANGYKFTQDTSDVSRFDGKDVLVTVGGKTSSAKLSDSKLVVKELEAKSITPTISGTVKLSYNAGAGDTFDASAVTGASVAFNDDTLASTYDSAAKSANGTEADDAKHYYFELDNGAKLYHGDAMDTTMNGRTLYICYKDVNDHVVRYSLGILTVSAGTPTVVDNVHSIFTKDPTTGTQVQNKGDTGHSVTVAGQTADVETKWYAASDIDPASLTAAYLSSKTPATTFASGTAYTVVTVVKPEDNYQFTDETKFYFVFPTLGERQVTVTGTAYSGLVKGGAGDPNYYMWYTFDPTAKTVSSVTAAEGYFGGPYYAQTTDRTISHNASKGSGNTGYLPNGTDNTPTPGGKAGVGYTFKYVINSVTLKYDHDTATTVKVQKDATDEWTITYTTSGTDTVYKVEKDSVNTGKWKVTKTVSGTPTVTDNLAAIPADLQQDIDYLTNAKAYVDGVALDYGYPFAQATNDVARFNDKDVYVTTGGKVTTSPLQHETTLLDLETAKLEVRELTVDPALSATVSGLNLVYADGASFNSTGVSDVKANFNAGTGVAVTGYAPTEATDDATSADAQHWYFQLDDGTKLYSGSSVSAAMNNHKLYLRYTDVNDHVAELELGTLTVGIRDWTEVRATVKKPIANTTIATSQITILADQPYKITEGTYASYKWQHWNGTDWEDVTEPTTGKFVAGDKYRAVVRVNIIDPEYSSMYRFTSATKGYVRVDDGAYVEATGSATDPGKLYYDASGNTTTTGYPTYVELTREFTVEKEKVVVRVKSLTPAESGSGHSGSSLKGSVGYSDTADNTIYDLNVKWYSDDTFATQLDDGDISPNTWYYLVAEATLKDDAKARYEFSTDRDHYLWVDNTTTANLIADADPGIQVDSGSGFVTATTDSSDGTWRAVWKARYVAASGLRDPMVEVVLADDTSVLGIELGKTPGDYTARSSNSSVDFIKTKADPGDTWEKYTGTAGETQDVTWYEGTWPTGTPMASTATFDIADPGTSTTVTKYYTVKIHVSKDPGDARSEDYKDGNGLFFNYVNNMGTDGVIRAESMTADTTENAAEKNMFKLWDDDGELYVIHTFALSKTFVHTTTPGQTIYVPGGGGGTTVVTQKAPVVYYKLRDLGVTKDLTAESVEEGESPKAVPAVTPLADLKFLGWSETDPDTIKDGSTPKLVDPKTFTIDDDKIFYAVYEAIKDPEKFDHSHYVIGFPDGTFGPDNNITRGQVATIVARACLEGFVEGANYGNPGGYSDVAEHWAYSAISYCTIHGVMNGYEDGTFRPDGYITRQELANVVARLAGVQQNQGLSFTDTADIADWAMNGVYTTVAKGWVNGYEEDDGTFTFRPERKITRAETVKIFNGYLGRGVDEKGLADLKQYVHSGVASNNTENGYDEYMVWPDVVGHWAYYEIIEAANNHDFHAQDESDPKSLEQWDRAFIDEIWRYYDDASDGADDVDRNNAAREAAEQAALAAWQAEQAAAEQAAAEQAAAQAAAEQAAAEQAAQQTVEEPVDVTVTYVVKSNGEVVSSLTETVTAGGSPSSVPMAVANAGYVFRGWSDADPEGEGFDLSAHLVEPASVTVTEDTTFYAVFEQTTTGY